MLRHSRPPNCAESIALDEERATPFACAASGAGTGHTVRAEAGSLDLTTGVGPALRMIHMTVPSSATLEASGKRVALTDLKPGDVIHAQCRLTAQGMVAEAIRVLPVAQTQGPGPA